MKTSTRFSASLLLAALLTLMLTITVSANAAQPPNLTIIVPHAPDDLSISLLFDGNRVDAVTLPCEDKVLERYYRIFSGQLADSKSTSSFDLNITSEDYNFDVPLSESQFDGYSNIVTLNLGTQTLTEGEAPLRTVFYIAMRVALTLLIEGVIFYLFGFRMKKSWKYFLFINLITQTGLNLCLTGPDIGRTYWFIALVFFELIILITELIAFCVCVKEHSKRRICCYVFLANIASLFAGGFFIAMLPV